MALTRRSFTPGSSHVERDAFLTGGAVTATAAVATDGTNATLVTITARDAAGAVVPGAVFDVFLSDSTAGIGYSASTASGAVTVKTAGTTGTLLGTLLAKFGLRVQTNASGTFGLSITDTAKTAFKVCVAMPNGNIVVVATLATASYG